MLVFVFKNRLGTIQSFNWEQGTIEGEIVIGSQTLSNKNVADLGTPLTHVEFKVL